MEGYGTLASGDGSAPPSLATNGDGDGITFQAGDSTTLLVREKTDENDNDSNAAASSLFDCFKAGSRRQDNKRWMTVLLVLNYMIGSGILNTAQTFRDSGLAATTMLYLIACPALWLGMVLLIKATEASAPSSSPAGAVEAAEGSSNNGRGHTAVEDLEYAALAERTLGRAGPYLVDVSILVLNFGAVMSYVILVGGLTTSLLSGTKVAEWFPLLESFYFVTPCVVAFPVFQICLIRHFSNTRVLAAVSLGVVTGVVILVVILGPFLAEAERQSTEGGSAMVRPDAPLLWWNWTGSFAKMGSVIFSLTCAPAALHSYTAMEKRDEREWSSVSKIAVVLGGILCFVTGIAGYLSFREATEGDILDNFSGWIASIFKIGVVGHLILYIPNEVIILRASLFTLAGYDVMNVSDNRVLVVTGGILSLIVGVDVSLMLMGFAHGDLFGYILDLTGGVTASLTSFVLPALAYLSATSDAGGKTPSVSFVLNGIMPTDEIAAYRKGSWALLVFGCAVMVLVPSGVVFSILSGK